MLLLPRGILPSLADHPFPRLRDAGVVVTLLCWHAAAHAEGLNDHVGPAAALALQANLGI